MKHNPSLLLNTAITIIIIIVFAVTTSFVRNRNESKIKCEDKPLQYQHTFDDLLDAIEWVESKDDANAIGDNGNAVGAYQIWKIYVDDVNRIFKTWRPHPFQRMYIYTYADRFNKEKSREMVTIYLKHYGKNKSFEAMARIHNGGPNGWKKECTKPYWLKIKARMELK